MISEKEKQIIIDAGARDPVFFCKYYLPHIFPQEIPWVHRGILAILTRKCEFLEDYGEVDKIIENFVYEVDGVQNYVFFYRYDKLCMTLNKYSLLMLPRGFSKTMIAGVAVPLIKILYEETRFLVYVSEAGPHAEMQLGNVKWELEGNENIKLIFGNLVPERTSGLKWASDMIETTTGVTVVAKGRGAQIRGLNNRGNRPDTVIGDDLEDKESVATDLQRRKTRAWAYGSLMPALAELDENATITALGTLLHTEALLAVWSKDKAFTVVKFGARDREGKPLWPLMMDDEKIEQKKEQFALAGELHTFYLEYFNEARSADVMPFKSEWIIHARPRDDLPAFFAMYCDPAISKNRLADHAVIAVNAILSNGEIFTWESWGDLGVSPREIVNKYFELSKLYRCLRHGVESNAYQAALIHLMQEEMARTGHWFVIDAVTHKTKKEDRILGVLLPRYANGYVKHVKPFSKLEAQMLDFQRGADQKDDYLDAQAGCFALLDPYAAVVAGESAKLPDLDSVMPDWRLH